jgi:pentatricopeptide repeat protein
MQRGSAARPLLRTYLHRLCELPLRTAAFDFSRMRKVQLRLGRFASFSTGTVKWSIASANALRTHVNEFYKDSTHAAEVYEIAMNLREAGDSKNSVNVITLLEDVQALGVQPSPALISLALAACDAADDHFSSVDVLDFLDSKSIVPTEFESAAAFETAICTCARMGNFRVALDLIEEMSVLGLQPGDDTRIRVADACRQAGEEDLAKRVSPLTTQGEPGIHASQESAHQEELRLLLLQARNVSSQSSADACVRKADVIMDSIRLSGNLSFLCFSCDFRITQYGSPSH